MINEYGNTTPAEMPTETSNDNVISKLNGLIETCRDGQEGFKTAAEGIENSQLKSVFYEYSQQRAEFLGVLQGLVRDLGGDPESTGSFSAAVHRGWIDIKSLVTGKDDGAILDECERGEDYAKDAYADALKSDLPANVAEVVNHQSQAILEAHNKIKSLRNTENSNTESGKSATPGTF